MSQFVRLAAYVSPLEAHTMPTGVGQHILGMFSALQQREDVLFSLVTSRGKEDEAQKFIASHPRSRLLPLPWPDRPLRLSTTWISLVNLDPWLGDADWVYAPVEQPVTTSRNLAVTVHDLYAFEPAIPGIPGKERAGLGWRRRMKRIFERANLIATVSEFTKSRMLELFDIPHPERIVVIGNGGSEGFSSEPSFEDESILRRYALQPAGYVLFPGSLTWRKGGDFLLEVAGLARARQAGLLFAVIGRRHDADLLALLRKMKERMPDFPVTLLGYVGKSELATLYRSARAAFFPSRYEGFGIPVVEALTSGCALFITGQPALVEVAAGSAAVIERDAASVLAALTNPNGRNVARAQFVQSGCDRTWSRCAARLVQAMQ